MKFSKETKLCNENHTRAQEELKKEEGRIAARNRQFRFPTLEALIKQGITYSDDDPTRKIDFKLPHCYIAQGNGGTRERSHNYQQDFYDVASDPRIAQLSIEKIKQLLYETFDETGELLAEMNSGSTLSVAIITANQIITAHIGDTRIILCHDDGTATALTWDHKAEAEKERIKAAGGIVTEAGVTANGAITIPRIGGMLAISRAFGNNHLIKGKLHTPSLNVQPLSKNDVLVIASDGLWDVVAPSEIAKVTKIGLKVVTDQARATAFKRGSVDNCTVLGAKNLAPNSIFFVGDSHGFDQQKKPLLEAMNTIKAKFFEILDEKIDRVLNPAVQARSSAEIIAQLKDKSASQESGGSAPEYYDDFNAISSAVQSSNTTANASTSTSTTTRTSHVPTSSVKDDDEVAGLTNKNGRKRRKTTDDNNDDDDTEVDEDNGDEEVGEKSIFRGLGRR